MDNLKSKKVAVIGAGPGGFYAALELLKQPYVQVDIIDKLPTPFGLVRYGIAPDNQKMKTVSKVFSGLFIDPTRLRFIGNVNFGTDLVRDDVLNLYDSVIYATGAPHASALGVPGEDLAGSFSAKDFVDWYNGYPFRNIQDFSLDFSTVAVVGGGNVALDVARMLANEFDVVKSTDVPDAVLKAFERSAVRDVHLLVRKGPVQAKFTPVELRGLGNLKNVDVIVDPEDLVLTEDEQAYISGNQQCRTNMDIFRSIAARQPAGHGRRVFIRFWCSVTAIGGERKVQWLELLNGKGANVARDQSAPARVGKIPVDAVFSAIGHIVGRLPGVPFDEQKSIIPNIEGRIIDEDGGLSSWEFVSGWAKRGPSGTVGTNREDSKQTVNSLLASWGEPGREGGARSRSVDVTALLTRRDVRFTCWQDWLRIDAAEVSAGAQQGRIRVKLSNLNDMVACLKDERCGGAPADQVDPEG